MQRKTFGPKEFRETKEEQRKNEWTTKRMHRQFARDMEMEQQMEMNEKK